MNRLSRIIFLVFLAMLFTQCRNGRFKSYHNFGDPRLDLSRKYLKVIPDYVFEHEELKVLNLRNNRLTSVPPEIGKLTKL